MLQLPTGQIKMQLMEKAILKLASFGVATPHGSDKNAT